MNTYQIYFRGYRRDENVSGLPSYSGIYIVYTCIYNEDQRTVTLKKLIYIGQAQDIKERVCTHDMKEKFLAELQNGEELCYAYAEIDKSDLNIVENALIFSQKPKLNSQYTRSFNYPPSRFIVEGKCALLNHKDFSIE